MRTLPILTILLPVLAACQGPSLGDALPGRALPGHASTAEAPSVETPEGLRAFLAGGERGPRSVADMDRAIGTVLDAKARARQRSPEIPAFGCDNEDELDRFACDRGLTRDAARQFYKNRGYKPAELAPKSEKEAAKR